MGEEEDFVMVSCELATRSGGDEAMPDISRARSLGLN